MKNKLTLLAAFLLAIVACTAASKQKATEEMDKIETRSGKTITITPIKHASMEIVYDGKIFEIDPVTTAVQPETDYKKLRKADYILITHEHFDHLDKKAVEDLSKANTVIITNNNCKKILGKGVAMSNGEKKQISQDISIEAVPTYNITPGHTQYHPKGRDNGFILNLDGTRIYIAGDTENIPEMKKLGHIDVAFLPCNQPYTMTPAQMRKAADMFKPAILYPYHFSSTPKEEMEQVMQGSGIEVRMRNFE